MRAYYSGSLPTIGLSRRLRRQMLGESLAMAQGTLQPWNLPEMRPLIQAQRAGTEQMLGYLPDILARSGVRGPAAALTLEKAGEAGSNQLLNLMNQIRAEESAQGLGLAGQEERAYQNLLGLDLSRYGLKLQKQALEEQRKKDAWNRLMSVIQTIGSVGAGAMSGIGSGGVGAGLGSAGTGLAGSLSATGIPGINELGMFLFP